MKKRLLILATASALFLARSAATFAQAMPAEAPQVSIEDDSSSRWPMLTNDASGMQITIFKPQLEAFNGNQIWAHSAISVTPVGAPQPIFGAIWMNSRVDIDRVARTVRILDLNITGTRFPDTDSPVDPTLYAAVQQAILRENITLSLDHLLESVQVLQQKTAAAATLQSTPPRIIFLNHMAMKVQYDGAPRLELAPNTNIMTVINTPFFVALDPASHWYFLKGGGRWFTAADPMGSFRYVPSAPPAISQLADTMGYQDPQTALSDVQAAGLQIIAAADPTELIWTDGPEQMSTLPGTGLLYVANTDSDVFVDISTQQRFVLLSGRWFSAPSESGPWTFVNPTNLPPDFAKIPTDSPRADVLADVPGTQQANDAVADATIPQTAAVDRSNFQQPAINYDGTPSFQPVAGTPITYAVNTPQCVLLYGGIYYCCFNGVWYQSYSPNGPWALCIAVPPDIYTIPPSCPDYPCTFCNVYGYTPDLVYCGYTPGYVGCYSYDGIVCYGTGFRYDPWIGRHYFARPHTFGFAARYNAYQGHWGFSFGLSAAGGGGGSWVGNNPRFEGRSGEWFGFGGYRPTFQKTEVVGVGPGAAVDRTRRDIYARNVYEGRKDLHPDAPGVRTGPIAHPSEARPTEGSPDNVYADPKGNIYRKTDNGWEVRQGNDWKPSPSVGGPVKAPLERARPEAPPAPVGTPVKAPVESAHPEAPRPPQAEPARTPEEPARPAPEPVRPAPEPARPAPEPARPAPEPERPSNPYEGLNNDARAREGGEQRSQPAPAPAPAPAENGGRRR